ncbi:AAA family ATPase [Variovorax sp. E3]|uniref:AAA family ATPase n=1 Tax=Variovorax sp. E3 TaxID=1914993 RepID=UPI0022B6268D|nr:AAA family ATPase [Variovorax sp. E3]
MKLPTLSEITEEQFAVVEYSVDASILVVGPPGAGKTSMAILRARLLISPEHRRSVVMVTRNRLLTSVAGQLAKENQALIRTETMHSLVAGDYYQRFNAYVPQSRPFEFIWAAVLERYEKAGVRPHLDHLVIDEGQNLPIEFIQWAVRFGAKAVSLFADEDQATLGRGSKVAEYHAAGFTAVLPLLINHRSTAEIVEFAEHFHRNRVIPRAAARRGGGFDRPWLIEAATWDDLANTVASRYANRAEALGVIVFRKTEVTHLAALLRQRLGATRVDSYTSDADTGVEHAIRMRDNGVTVICGESAIGLEFDTLYLQDLWRSLPPAQEVDYRRMYMLSARARDSLVLVNGPETLTEAQLASLPAPPILDR